VREPAGADPRDRHNLDQFLAGAPAKTIDREERMAPEALERFAEGVEQFDRGQRAAAIGSWRRALELDPDNFVIRSQIWAVEHPKHFYPAVDRDWQEQQLPKEGYDRPLP
jgi:hypothetical protein